MTAYAPKSLAELEDYDDVVERWLSSLTLAQRFKGLAPAQRLEGLTPAMQQRIRQRIGRPG